MAEQKIITEDDIREVFPFSENVDDDKVDAGILRAQQGDLKPILGDPLYYAFIEDWNGTGFDTSIYQKLYDGGEYLYNSDNIYFSGVRQLLSIQAFIRVSAFTQINIVESGSVRKVTEESEYLEDFQTRANTRKAIDESIRIEAEVIKFLSTERNNYPLFNRKSRTEQDHKTSFKFTRV